MMLSHTARPGKPPKPPRVIPGPWSVHSQPLSEGDVSLCFKILHHGGLQPQGDPAACSALRRNCWVFLVVPTFPYRGKYVSVALPAARSLVGCCGSQREQAPSGPKPWTRQRWWEFCLYNEYVLINEW